MLKDWFVGYLNLDTGKTGHACFTGPSAAEARNSFRECYRRANYKILCCVPYREWVCNEQGDMVAKNI